jgi:O-antigen ligase/tetratricopeptide (TPR) repeat protein
MSQRHRQRRESPARGTGAEGLPRLVEKLRLGLLAVAVALTVVAPLMPSEAVTGFGVNAPVTMGWLVLLVAWATLAFAQPSQPWKWDWSDAWLLGLVAWHTLAGVVALFTGAPRPALNVTWLWISYATGYMLLRQALRTDLQRRALVAVMLALGVVLASHGLYQYFYSAPQTRAEYVRDPESVMRKAGVMVVPGTPEAEQFRNRIESTEPLASFGLTNSLAGFLAPWLVVGSGLGLGLLLAGRLQSREGLAVLLALAVLAGCLFLTKSRTGVLATAAGAALLLAMIEPWKLRLSWKRAAILAGVLAGAVFVALLSRGWDRLVLTEAPKSLKYRLEYWQATAAMIAEHPWLGVGPGNFQDWYPRYKLPQASETIADPHNYLLEMAATAGLPALLLLVGWQVALLVRLCSGNAPAVETEAETGSRYVVYVGFALGLFLVMPFDLLVAFVPEGAEPVGSLPVAWVIGGPLAALVLWGLDRWVVQGRLAPSLFGAGLATLGINLLAAGSLMFPGVMTTAWALAAVALSGVSPAQPDNKVNPALRWVGLALAIALAVLAHQTLYYPVLASQSSQYEASEARARGEPARARQALQQWIAADPWSADPWRSLAELEQEQWLASDDAQPPALFTAAVARLDALSPNSPKQPDQKAQWYWTAWRRGKGTSWRDEALRAWQEAVQRYPQGNYLRAQYAWALAESGRLEEARDQAEQALALDAQNPHREQQLAQRHLFDPLPGADSPYRSESAAASLQRILGP